MTQKWSNLNLPGALHFTGNCVHRLPVFTCCEALADAPLAVDRAWWWPDDSEKLSAAMKKMGWHNYWVRDDGSWEG